MFKILGTAGRLCDTVSRRELLTIGSLSLVGLSLPDCLRRKALADVQPDVATSSRPDGFGRAKSVILVYLQGSPSHIDLWDPKPEAPAEIRGEFRPISTRAPGMMLGEVLPMLAEQAHRFSLVRSIGVNPKGLRNHGAAIYMLMTGHDPTNFTVTGLAVPPSREDLPSVGSVIARYRPAGSDRLSYVAVGAPVKEGSQIGVGQGAGLLGATYDPFAMYDDPTQPLRLEALSLPGDVTLDRLHSRVDLRALVDARHAQNPILSPIPGTGATSMRHSRTGVTSAFDEHYRKAISLVQSNAAVKGFQLDRESQATRERYGIRGLLDSTLVVAIGEFGRSPKIGAPTTDNVGPGGRDHWPECYSFLIAGGGVRPGQVYGESDRFGGWPKSNAVHPYDLLATIHHALGIDSETEYRDTLNRPRRLVEHGRPIVGLF